MPRELTSITEIGHEKAQSVIDSITSSYADAGQANPMLQPPAGAGGFPPPLPGGLPGANAARYFLPASNKNRYATTSIRYARWPSSTRRTRHALPSIPSQWRTSPCSSQWHALSSPWRLSSKLSNPSPGRPRWLSAARPASAWWARRSRRPRTRPARFQPRPRTTTGARAFRYGCTPWDSGR